MKDEKLWSESPPNSQGCSEIETNPQCFIIIMEYSRLPNLIGRKENNPLPSKEDNWIIRGGMSLLSTFASNLKRYRTERGLSQEEFADIAGLHRTYISAIEREKRSISVDNIEKIALALEINAYLLFVDNDKQSIPPKKSKEVR